MISTRGSDMKILRKTSFERAYRKLDIRSRTLVDDALRLFEKNPFDARLRNHLLTGTRHPIRSIRAAYDLRILYAEVHEHAIVLLLTVGTHDEVY
jgi:mRNA-degrading endonuclease YafQ of YafQ-DinJ toxin-antitoxin module